MLVRINLEIRYIVINFYGWFFLWILKIFGQRIMLNDLKFYKFPTLKLKIFELFALKGRVYPRIFFLIFKNIVIVGAYPFSYWIA